MRWNDRSLAYALLRIALGVNFAGHGLIRIYNGVGVFAASTAEHLAKSPLPHGLTLGFSYAIPFFEAIIGLTLVLGVFTRVFAGVRRGLHDGPYRRSHVKPAVGRRRTATYIQRSLLSFAVPD
jgi:hypothetical protein